jgi:hypothetical protein
MMGCFTSRLLHNFSASCIFHAFFNLLLLITLSEVGIFIRMTNDFFLKPILNSPYSYPARHWELDPRGQPTQHIIETRRKVSFITPIPKPRRHRGEGEQSELVFDEGLDKKATMETYWVPGINNSGQYGRWAFAEFRDVYLMEEDFKAKVEGEFNKMIENYCAQSSK